MERVLCAAILIDDKVRYSLQPINIETGYIICGWRHGCCIEQFKAVYGDPNKKLHCSIQTR